MEFTEEKSCLCLVRFEEMSLRISKTETNSYCLNLMYLKRKAFFLPRKSDTTHPHVINVTQQTIMKLRWEVLPHAADTPGLSLSDYHLFCSLRHSLPAHHFQQVLDIEEFNPKLESFLLIITHHSIMAGHGTKLI